MRNKFRMTWNIKSQFPLDSKRSVSQRWILSLYYLINSAYVQCTMTRRCWYSRVFTYKIRDWGLCNKGYREISFVHDIRLSNPIHDDVIKWKHFPRYWPFVRGIHQSLVNSPHKGQWRGALTFSLICVWINGWVNKREAGDLRRYPAHFDVTVMPFEILHQAVYCCTIPRNTSITQWCG